MRNWANLPHDLLNLILSRLYGKERHTFSLVCRSWNKAASISPYRYSPCLMYYHRGNHMWKSFQYNGFFNMCKLENAHILCSKYGWFLMARNDNSIFFFDPCNNQRIELPCKLCIRYTTVCFFHPPTSPGCVVLGIATPRLPKVVNIGLLKHGECEWESYKYCRGKIKFFVSHASPILHDGLVYFLDVKGNVAAFNIMSTKSEEKPCWFVYSRCLGRRRGRRLDWKIKEHFLFKVKGEKGLFAVFVKHDGGKVNVFRLLEPTMKWELVKDLKDKVVYLSPLSSFGYISHFKNMANRIYFPKFHGDDESAVYYSLCTGKYHSLDGNYSDDNTYGLKRLDLAAWMMPAPPPTSLELLTRMTWCREVD